jgi:hypothetical protein
MDRDTLRARLTDDVLLRASNAWDDTFQDRWLRDCRNADPNEPVNAAYDAMRTVLLDALCPPTPEPSSASRKIGEELGLSENLIVVPEPQPTPADAPPAETPQPIHNSCHEVWCNGSRHEPRGAKGYSCSCRPRGSIADKAEYRAEQAEAERDAAIAERDALSRKFHAATQESTKITTTAFLDGRRAGMFDAALSADRLARIEAERDALKAELAMRPLPAPPTEAP